MEDAEREVACNSDKLKLRKLCKTARLRSKFFINYVQLSEFSYLIECMEIEAKNDWTVVKVSAKNSY